MFKDVEKVFEEMRANEDKEKGKSHIIKEMLHLLSNEKAAHWLVDVLSMLKEESNSPRISKNIAYMTILIPKMILFPKLIYKLMNFSYQELY